MSSGFSSKIGRGNSPYQQAGLEANDEAANKAAAREADKLLFNIFIYLFEIF
jgi:hypothetical protein